MPGWPIGEIAKLADVTPRTVRYYVELGLLPPPEGLGRSAAYSQEHLDRLLVIKHMQSGRFSLEEIREQLATMGPAETTRLASETPSPDATSAAQYLAGLRGSTERHMWRDSKGAAADISPQSKPRPRDSYIGEQWTRIPLSENIELHVKRHGNRIDHRIARLIKEARLIISEEDPK